MSTDKKISTLVDQQFPFFVRDDGPNLIAFVKAYYEWMEQANNAIEVSQNLLNYQDIDDTYDKYLEYFHREIMGTIPRSTLADRKKLAKHVKDLHRGRGSELSYRLLFRILFNEEIEFYYPGEDMLRASDGRWVIENAIRLGPPRASTYVVSAFLNERIIGLTSGATARVTRISEGISSGTLVDELFLIDIDGTFQDNEVVTLFDDRTIFATIFATSGALRSVNIQTAGAFHQEGDSVTFTSASGSGANGIVTQTSGDSAVRWLVERGGSGYTTGATINIYDQGSGTGTNFVVGSIANTETISVNQDTIQPMASVVLNTGPTFVSLGANSASVSANLASANVSSTLISALNYQNTITGTIASLTTTASGSGYSPILPSANVVQTNISAMDIPDPDGGFKGRNAAVYSEHVAGAIDAVRVIFPGQNYNRFDTVTITNISRSGTENASGSPNVTGVINYPGRYIDTKGWLSWNNKLQDNFYYQEFSYEIKSNQFNETYRDLVNSVLHPAGTKIFGRVRLFANAVQSNTVVESKVRIYTKGTGTLGLTNSSFNVTGSSTLFESELEANSQILTVGTSANGMYFVNTISTNTAMTIHGTSANVGYEGQTNAAADYYYVSNTSA